MANYTFTASSSYALSTHEVIFTDSSLTIKLISTGQTVYSKSYSNGIAFMCESNDFSVGTLADNGVFTKTIDLSDVKAKIWLTPSAGQNMLIGTDDEDNGNIYNNYNLNQCPVRIKPGARTAVKMECPCESASGTCANSCYSYGT